MSALAPADDGHHAIGPLATTRRGFLALAVGSGIALCQAGAAEPAPMTPTVVTADDIAWLRQARAVWVRLESGAPAIVPPETEAGAYIDRQLATPASSSPPPAPERLEPVLCAFFLNATFRPGHYSLDPPLRDGDAAAAGIASGTVEVGPEHLLLLKNSLWNGPLMDGKRPYGTRTFYEADMAEILGRPTPGAADGQVQLPAAERHAYQAMHRAMQSVVQAYIQHAQYSAGAYILPRDGWTAPFRPLCEPVTPQRLAAYQAFCDSHPPREALPAPDMSDPRSLDAFMRSTTAAFWAKAALFEPG